MVSWGCSGGAQRSCGDHLHLIQLGLKAKSELRKMANFPYMHVEMGWICPMWPSTLLVTKWAPMCKKVMSFCSPHHQGLKNCGLSQKNIFKFSIFFPRGDFCGLRAVGHMSWLANYLAVPAAPGRLNATCA